MSKKNFAFYTIILTYFIIVFGGYVASSESGLGCGPEWPLCNGSIIPVLEGDTLIEFGHRVIGIFLFVFTIILFFKVKKSSKTQLEMNVAILMLGLLTLQLIMGAIVVFYHLPSIVITAHLLIAMVFLAILIWFYRYEHGYSLRRNKLDAFWRKHLNVIIGLLFITIGIGAYIKHQQYGLACGWLTCGDSLMPESIPQVLQSIHRLLAVISMVYIVYLTYKAFSLKSVLMRVRTLMALVVVLLQLILGIFTILSFISIPVAVLHLAAATLLFAIIVEARMIFTN